VKFSDAISSIFFLLPLAFVFDRSGDIPDQHYSGRKFRRQRNRESIFNTRRS